MAESGTTPPPCEPLETSLTPSEKAARCEALFSEMAQYEQVRFEAITFLPHGPLTAEQRRVREEAEELERKEEEQRTAKRDELRAEFKQYATDLAPEANRQNVDWKPIIQFVTHWKWYDDLEAAKTALAHLYAVLPKHKSVSSNYIGQSDDEFRQWILSTTEISDLNDEDFARLDKLAGHGPLQRRLSHMMSGWYSEEIQIKQKLRSIRDKTLELRGRRKYPGSPAMASAFYGVGTRRSKDVLKRILLCFGRGLTIYVNSADLGCSDPAPNTPKFLEIEFSDASRLKLNENDCINEALSSFYESRHLKPLTARKLGVRPIQRVGKRRKVKRAKGRPFLSPAEESKRLKTLKLWDRAKSAGTSQKIFCQDEGISQKYLNTCVNWRTKRSERI
jgi:hypothetical protein